MARFGSSLHGPSIQHAPALRPPPRSRDDDGYNEHAKWAFRDHFGQAQLAGRATRDDVLNLVRVAPRTAHGYLHMLIPRLIEARKVLADDGTIFVHCDPTANHWVRAAMDLVFGPERWLNEIVCGAAPTPTALRVASPLYTTRSSSTPGASGNLWMIRGLPTRPTTSSATSAKRISMVAISSSLATAPGDRTGTRAHYRWKGSGRRQGATGPTSRSGCASSKSRAGWCTRQAASRDKSATSRTGGASGYRLVGRHRSRRIPTQRSASATKPRSQSPSSSE